MTQGAPDHAAIAQTLNRVMAADRGRLLSALTVRLRDFQLAEEVLQEAAVSALSHWGRTGVPASPVGWLLRVGLRKAIDRLRSAARGQRQAADLALLARDEAEEAAPDTIPDDRLRLIFTCCHPALEPKTRVALTLRTLCGLTTEEVAGVFLDADTAMGQRLSRAKAKIAAARIPFVVPGPEDWDARLNSVLTVIYLIFTQGHALGPACPRDLCDEALYLARLVNAQQPGQAETEGCLALILLTHARRAARVAASGHTVPLLRQNRGQWDQGLIAEGLAVLERAIAQRKPGPFQIKAAIAALHVAEAGPDWDQIAALYGRLLGYEPTAVVRLNHAVAVAEGQGADAGLCLMEALSEALAGYQPFHAAHAEYLARAGHPHAARMAYDRAITLAQSSGDALFLAQRRAALPD